MPLEESVCSLSIFPRGLYFLGGLSLIIPSPTCLTQYPPSFRGRCYYMAPRGQLSLSFPPTDLTKSLVKFERNKPPKFIFSLAISAFHGEQASRPLPFNRINFPPHLFPSTLFPPRSNHNPISGREHMVIKRVAY